MVLLSPRCMPREASNTARPIDTTNAARNLRPNPNSFGRASREVILVIFISYRRAASLRTKKGTEKDTAAASTEFDNRRNVGPR